MHRSHFPLIAILTRSTVLLLPALALSGMLALATMPAAGDSLSPTLRGGNTGHRLLVQDPLTSNAPVPGEQSKRTVGGRYDTRGWRATKDGDMLVIELAGTQGLAGTLEVDVSDLDWRTANTATGEKIHFLNMFSNPIGTHHRVRGGTNDDALWTLRGGRNAAGALRYGSSFKALWAAKGAKSTPGSDYHEAQVTLPTGWVWERGKVYTFRVEWNSAQAALRVFVNGEQALAAPWKNQVTPLRYIFLGKARDFNTWVGPTFSNLRFSGPATSD